MHLCIDLKSFTDDRLRTHIRNADPVDFLTSCCTWQRHCQRRHGRGCCCRLSFNRVARAATAINTHMLCLYNVRGQDYAETFQQAPLFAPGSQRKLNWAALTEAHNDTHEFSLSLCLSHTLIQTLSHTHTLSLTHTQRTHTHRHALTHMMHTHTHPQTCVWVCVCVCVCVCECVITCERVCMWSRLQRDFLASASFCSRKSTQAQ